LRLPIRHSSFDNGALGTHQDQQLAQSWPRHLERFIRDVRTA
jgi:hypothetical protein